MLNLHQFMVIQNQFDSLECLVFSNFHVYWITVFIAGFYVSTDDYSQDTYDYAPPTVAFWSRIWCACILENSRTQPEKFEKNVHLMSMKNWKEFMVIIYQIRQYVDHLKIYFCCVCFLFESLIKKKKKRTQPRKPFHSQKMRLVESSIILPQTNTCTKQMFLRLFLINLSRNSLELDQNQLKVDSSIWFWKPRTTKMGNIIHT